MWLTTKKYKGKGSVGLNTSSEYHLFKKFTNNLKIRYDIGLMPLYCYRVSGRGALPYIFKPVKGFNNKIVYSQIYNIFARSIEEVPLELKRQDFKGYVFKVYKYEKAIYNQDFINDVNDGVVDPNDYGFIDVTRQFCRLPASEEFCNYNYEFFAKGDLIVEVAKAYIGSGNFKLKGHCKIIKSTNYSYKVKTKIKNRIVFNGHAKASGVNLLPTKAFISSGKLQIYGNAKYQNNDVGLIKFIGKGDLEVINFNNYTYNPKDNVFNPTANNNVIAPACSCPVLTNTIYFGNSIFKRNSILDKFLFRNNLSGKEIINLYFDNKNQNYFNSIKFNGLSLSEGNQETWNISTTFGCTNQVDLNKNKLWLFSCVISRKIFNNKNATNLESKLSIYFPFNVVCTKIDAIEFYNRVNLKEQLVYNKYKDRITNIQISVLKDNIKLFTSGNWLLDPFFNIFIYSKPSILESYYRPEVAWSQTNIRNAISGRQEA